MNGSVNDTMPMSYRALVTNREYKRWRMACSTPPVYWSAGIQRSTGPRSKGRSSSRGEQYRKKYQDESTKVSMVSVSRRAGFPQRGQVTLTNPSRFASGDSPCGEKSTSWGSTTGRSSSGTGTSPSSWQWMMGMGAPQYRCLEISQSRRRKDTAWRPVPCSSSHAVTAGMLSGVRRPSKGPEFTMMPSCSWALPMRSPCSVSPSGWMTTRIGRPCSVANSKSRWSCAGTPITAPVPYSMST